jgi:type IV pilus assembly protein PilY1
VDGIAEASQVGTQDLLVCGLGKGGKGYFCLDITNPNGMVANDVLWEYPTSGADDDLGYTFSRVEIANTAAGKVMIFGNGYDSVNGSAVFYVLSDINSSAPTVTKIDTGVGGCNGLATPALVDVNADGYVDFAFAGDLKGNLWKFDLRSDSIDHWKSYFLDGSTPKPLVSVQNALGISQPITVAPEVMLDCTNTAYGEGLMVIFGTGQYLTVDDLSDSTKHTFYGIWDWSDIWEQNPDHGYDIAKTKHLGQLGTDRSVANISGKTLQAQTVESETADYITLTDNPLEWYNPITDTGSHMGWFYDLPDTRERCIREPLLRLGVAVLVSTIPSESPCEAGGSSVIYQVNPCTGGRTEYPQFDINGDDKIDANDLIDNLPPTGEKQDEILFEPIELGDRLYFPDSGGGIDPMLVPANPQGMLYWRMIE